MTEWNAPEYARISALQQTMAEQALALLKLQGTERVLDMGCGSGKITAEIAARLPKGEILGVDSSAKMIGFAAGHATAPNLHFQTVDIRRLPFREEFDLVVSFNALHWIAQQDEALRSLCAAMKKDGRAQLRLVPAGARKSLEDVIEEARLSSRWSGFYHDFQDPYLHLTPEQYVAAAERNGLRADGVQMEDIAWDFQSRAAFFAFGSVTFVEWTQFLPEAERPEFIHDVLDRYRKVASEENTFKFYQMDLSLSRG